MERSSRSTASQKIWMAFYALTAPAPRRPCPVRRGPHGCRWWGLRRSSGDGGAASPAPAAWAGAAPRCSGHRYRGSRRGRRRPTGCSSISFSRVFTAAAVPKALPTTATAPSRTVMVGLSLVTVPMPAWRAESRPPPAQVLQGVHHGENADFAPELLQLGDDVLGGQAAVPELAGVVDQDLHTGGGAAAVHDVDGLVLAHIPGDRGGLGGCR